MNFEIDWRALALLGLLGFLGAGLYRWGREFSPPLIFFSKVEDFPGDEGIWSKIKEDLARSFTYAALVCFLIAFIDPHFLLERKWAPGPEARPPEQGIAIYLLLDQSGSMAQEVSAKTTRRRSEKLSKLDLLKQVTKEFIQGSPSGKLKGRPEDMIGMVKFARTAQVEVPLTQDHQTIIDRLNELKVVETEEENGTAMGYAIYKTAGLIAATRHFAEDLAKEQKPAYEIKDAIIIVVTDGFPSPNPLDKGRRLRNLDLEEAAQFAKENNVHLYIVNIDPEFAAAEYAPNRRVLQKVAEMTGGQFFMSDGTTGLADIYADIDRLEKSRFPEEAQDSAAKEQAKLYRQFSLYPFLIALGILCLAFASIWDTLIWRRMP